MATASKKTTPPGQKKSAKLPSKTARARLLIADDIRAEESGKVTAIGMYADLVVVLRVDESQPGFDSTLPYGMDALCVLVNVSGLSGKHKLRLEFGAYRNNAPAPAPAIEQEYDFANEGHSVNLLAKFRPLVIRTFGKKTVTLCIDDRQRINMHFEIRKEIVTPGELAIQLTPLRQL